MREKILNFCLTKNTQLRWVDDDRGEEHVKLFIPLFFISIQFDNWKTFHSLSLSIGHNDSFEPHKIPKTKTNKIIKDSAKNEEICWNTTAVAEKKLWLAAEYSWECEKIYLNFITSELSRWNFHMNLTSISYWSRKRVSFEYPLCAADNNTKNFLFPRKFEFQSVQFWFIFPANAFIVGSWTRGHAGGVVANDDEHCTSDMKWYEMNE